MGQNQDRALVLLQQSRYDLAERELRQELAGNPDNATAHALLSLCLSTRSEHWEAVQAAREAVRISPDDPFAHYSLAGALHELNDLDEAEQSIEEAIRLDPEDADYYARRAAIQFDRERWREALASAEEGLSLDPEHLGCNNLRAMALVKLGRTAEAGITIEAALTKDPEDALSHANRGWTYLHQANHDQACAHFHEALRLDPGLEWAREGIVTALKAKHLLYGLILRYFLWMSRLPSKTRWMVVFGGYFGYRLLREVGSTNRALAPFVLPLLALYALFFLFTWIADPLFNLVLRLNRFGRMALSRDQISASNWVGGTFVAALAAGVVWLTTGDNMAFSSALLFGALLIAEGATFQCPEGGPRKGMVWYTMGLAVVGGIGLVFSVSGVDGGIGSTLWAVALLGAFGSTWIANFLIASRG